MRTVWLLVAAGLLLVTAASPPVVGAVPGPAVPPGAGSSAVAAGAGPTVGVGHAPSLLLRSWTIAPPPGMSEPRASPPTSALIETPPPRVPTTAPIVVPFANGTSGCCVEQVFTPPVGPFATIVLNYTGQAVGGVYDSSYRAYIDGVEVLFGTTPEYGRWFVTQNLSEYASLFHGSVNLTFILGAATTGGYFLTSVSLLFYPVAAGASPPPAPNLVIPLWSRQFVRPTAPVIQANATVPTNVSQAVLELYAYGFGADEFWWASSPSMRAVGVAVDGHPFATFFPFPYINTGGIDLFLWRPITSDFTLADRPYSVNVTGALGELEGTHEYSANLTGLTSGSDWLIAGALLLWTGPGIGPATSRGGSVTGPSTTQVGQTESASASFDFASALATPQGEENVSGTVAESFSGALRTATSGGTQWENVSELAQFSENTTSASGSGWQTEVARYGFPISADLGSEFVPTSTSNGTTYGNFTTYMLGVHQGWEESRSVSQSGPIAPRLVGSFALSDELGANGQFSGTGQTTGPNSFLVTGITSISSSTSKEFFEGGTGSLAAPTYSHLLAGSSFQPPPPYEAESVAIDTVQATPLPLTVSLVPSASIADLGQGVSLAASAGGGTGAFRYLWTGLPPGCSGSASSMVLCRPTAPGAFSVDVDVEDSAGDFVLAPALSLVVEVAPALTLSASSGSIDLGQNVSFAVSVSGGFAPYRCVWYVGGLPQSPLGPCAPTLALSPSAVGVVEVNVSFVDAAGFALDSAPFNVSVEPPPAVALFVSPASGSVSVGVPAEVQAVVTGGVAPFSFSWSLDGLTWSNGSGANVTFVGVRAGTHSLDVTVRDSAGTLAAAAPVELIVTAGPGSPGPTGAGASGGFPTWAGWAAVAAAAAEALLLVLLLLTRGPARRPPAAPRPARRRPPGAPPAG